MSTRVIATYKGTARKRNSKTNKVEHILSVIFFELLKIYQILKNRKISSYKNINKLFKIKCSQEYEFMIFRNKNSDAYEILIYSENNKRLLYTYSKSTFYLTYNNLESLLNDWDITKIYTVNDLIDKIDILSDIREYKLNKII
jgi:hypothetical protein